MIWQNLISNQKIKIKMQSSCIGSLVKLFRNVLFELTISILCTKSILSTMSNFQNADLAHDEATTKEMHAIKFMAKKLQKA